ncbi:Serine/threonine phosphatase stp [Listeria fleischmannii subsp. fleischmannii]|uniref:Serine/threonine phosphatase stp n=2 Tax=Listeria fleischmannii TaxID=1069827 RepID=A0A2X3H7P5_9LIST|nr:Serine/threonine phosphatase stp [Listeria fleischmannii subsp. fleischmannii]
MISEEEMKQVLMSRRTLAEKADTLITKANANGGEDNITVLLLERDKMRRGGRAS